LNISEKVFIDFFINFWRNLT